MKNTLHVIIFSLSLLFCSLIISLGFKNIMKEKRTVSVRGLCEREVAADTAVWKLSFSLGGNSLPVLQKEIISQTEFLAEGIGNPPLDPYGFVSAGLHDLEEGEIGTGNEKGIAFSRVGESMAGFSRIDFGKAGSDTLILPIFALDGKPYEIELFDGDPRIGGRLITVLHYEKPSIWNHYQEEIYHLPERLTGIRCLCFRMKDKVHMKGFRFEKQSRAFAPLAAGEADTVYGDSFRREGGSVKGIGNNVSLCFEEMDFGGTRECGLTIRGKTPLQVNTITVRVRNENGDETAEALDFTSGRDEQSFRISVPGGRCTVTFVFLPGSSFDFDMFRFEP
jgi:beta-galactosidase